MNFEKMYTTIDAHVAGEGFRIIVHSPFQLKEQKSLQAVTDDDPFIIKAKQLLLNEPRGHRGMNGCIILPAENADFSAVFMNHVQENYFSYSGMIAALTVLLETGQLPVKQNGVYTIETVLGKMTLTASVANQIVKEVKVINNHCTVLDKSADYTRVKVDERIYYLCTLPDSIPALNVEHLSAIMKWGREAVQKYNDTLFTGIVLVQQLSNHQFKSVTFERDGVILRSPGFDSSFALYSAQNEKSETINQVTNESVFGSELTVFESDNANKCAIKTQGFVTGEHRFIYDPEDPLESGFLLK